MKRIIVADSASNVFEFDGGMDYACTPLKILIDGQTFEDVQGVDLEDMVNKMERSATSSSSCPNTAEWLDAFEGHDEIFAVTISSRLSGSYNAAMVAKQEYEESHPGAQVEVVDSRMTGPGERLIMEKIAELAAAGLSFDSIKEKLAEYRQRMHLCFSLASIHNLAKNGRVSHLTATLFGVLGIRLLGRASDEGTIESVAKVRGEKGGIRSVVGELVEKGYQGGKCYISHTLDADLAGRLKEAILSRFPGSHIFIEANTALCSYYAERHGLIIGFEGGPR